MSGKKTPLYQVHEEAGAKIVDFHGWMLPIEYEGIIAEHEHVRKHAGLFDVSHMGEIVVYGERTLEFLNILLTNDIKAIIDDQCLYSPMCYENATIVDDLLAYRHNKEHVKLVVNASNTAKDLDFMTNEKKRLGYDDEQISLREVSENTGLLALQGPEAEEVLAKATDYDLGNIKRFRFAEDVDINDVKAIVSRTGYTGEDGFEIYVQANDSIDAWEAIMEAGAGKVKPIGLGARDTLRLEAGLVLYGNDIDDTTTPIEAGLGWTVKFKKDGFNGKDEMLRQHTEGPARRLVGFELIGRGIPRKGHEIMLEGELIGRVTSGTYSPSLKKSIGLGYVESGSSGKDILFDVIIRDKPLKAKVVDIPFYSR
ncbi:glycine cleavage system aminomethyltransferase GcvT [Candidatus Altiarchaeota archaeon]